MPDVYSMAPLYSKLQKRGFTKNFVKGVLPSWWDDSLANTPSGFQEAGMFLARLFNIQPSTLLSDGATAEFKFGARRFKHSQSTSVAELDAACALAFTAAKIAIRGIKAEFTGIESAAALRAKLLTNPDKRWIDFSSLVEHCWAVGVPVLHLRHFPSTKKMDGLAVSVEGRPVIILTSKRAHGFLLFHLAHEMGHIAEGHLADNSFVIDEEIDGAGDQADEGAANNYGFSLLTGESKFLGLTNKTAIYSANHLAVNALDMASSRRIDPTHIALATAHRWGRFPVGVAAVKLLTANRPSDLDVSSAMLNRNVRWDDLSDDDSILLKKLAGI